MQLSTQVWVIYLNRPMKSYIAILLWIIQASQKAILGSCLPIQPQLIARLLQKSREYSQVLAMKTTLTKDDHLDTISR